MNGVHDLGGMDGFGRVIPEVDEPVFHQPWEATIFGISLTALGQGANLDQFRHTIEQIEPAEYLRSSYYEHWLASLEAVYAQRGLIAREELERRVAEFARGPQSKLARREDPARAEAALAALRAGSSAKRKIQAKPHFKVGQAVIARNLNPTGHTRLPRYARVKRGEIESIHGAFVFPDDNAHGRGENPQYVYSVRFAARDLWGEAAEANHFVNLDLWESYLSKASRSSTKTDSTHRVRNRLQKKKSDG